MVVGQGQASTLAGRPADAVCFRQREMPMSALAPSWSDSEVGDRPVAGFLMSKPLRVTQIRRVLTLACGPRTEAAGRVLKTPAGTA